MALDATARLRWHILDTSLGQVGNLRRRIDISVFYLWINLRFAAKNIDLVDGESFFNKAFRHPADASRTINVDISAKLLVFYIDFAIVVLSLIFALSVSGQWDTFLRFRYGGSFGIADPLFGVDLGFYVFRLPFYELLQGSITVLTLSALGILAFCSLLGCANRSPAEISRLATAHASTSWFFYSFSCQLRWGFILDHYELVYSNLGVVHGAGYGGGAHHESRALGDDRSLCSGVCAACFGFFRPRTKNIVAALLFTQHFM